MSNEDFDTKDRLERMFKAQRELQVKSMGIPITSVLDNPVTRIDYFKENVLAATDELHEALAEIGWKSWATSRHFNEDAVKGELVDLFHFFMNLCIAANLSPGELTLKYFSKRAINAQRQKDKYDGVSTKCPECTRALDDPGVGCFKDDNGMGWCETRNQSYRST